MKLTVDPEADAVQIRLRDRRPGEITHSEPCDIEFTGSSVILEMGEDNRLIGFEILGASRILPEEIFEVQGEGHS